MSNRATFQDLFGHNLTATFQGKTIHAGYLIQCPPLAILTIKILRFKPTRDTVGFTIGTRGFFTYLDDPVQGRRQEGVVGIFTDSFPVGGARLQVSSKNKQLAVMPAFFEPTPKGRQPIYQSEGLWDALYVDQISDQSWRFLGNHTQDCKFQDIEFLIEISNMDKHKSSLLKH